MSLTLLVERGAEAQADAILCPLSQPRARNPALGCGLRLCFASYEHRVLIWTLYFLEDGERKVTRSVGSDGEAGMAEP